MLKLFESIKLDKSHFTPIYIQLHDSIKELIENGTLLRDFKLPSVRQFSSCLKINQITVVTAFNKLQEEGYIYKRPGSGTYVAGVPVRQPQNISISPLLISDELYQQDDIPFTSKGRITVNENTINFASATPTSELFPVEAFKLSINEVLERDKGNAFAYQDSQGFLPLRESISSLLTRHDIYEQPQNIQVISGAQQGIDIISKALLRQGDFVIAENPTYTGAAAVFKSRGAQVLSIEMKEDGPELTLLEYSLKKYKPRLIYTIPSFHNPTGYTYSEEKRNIVVKLAEKYNSYIIEDDYVSDLAFCQARKKALKSRDTSGIVILIKSFSKIFMPGLRLGFMAVPPGLMDRMNEAKHATDISTSGLIQRAFDVYIRKGFWDKHFDFMFSVYKERYAKMLSAMDKYLKKPVEYFKPGGGLNFWLTFPPGFPVDSLLVHSSSKGVVFAPGRIFYSGEALQRLYNIRLSFASVNTDQIDEGIKILCESIEEFFDKKGNGNYAPLL